MITRNNKGVSIVELMIYVGLSTVVILIATSIVQVSQEMVQSSTIFAGLNEARNTILMTLRDETAFKKTLAYPGNSAVFKCLNQHASCSGGGGTFTLLNAQGNVVAEAARPNTSDGLTRIGAPCTAYSASGNDACPFKFSVSWTARCPKATPFNPSPSCLDPSIEFAATLMVSSKTPIKDLNPSSYAIAAVKQNTSASLSETCTKMGGTFQPDGSCVMPYSNTQCPANSYIRGFLNGQPVCQPLLEHQCPTGQVLLGINANGVAQCGPGCTSGGSSSGAIW